MILSICEEPKALEIIKLIKLFINIIIIVAPIILIFSLIFLFMKNIKSDESDFSKTKKVFVYRLVAAALIFLIPNFVNIVVKVSAPNSEYTKCINNATDENIRIIAYERIKERIDILKTNLEYYYFDSIKRDLKYLSSEKKEEVLKELTEIKEYIEIMKQIKSLTKRDREKYKQLVIVVSEVDDPIIKETLTKEIEKYSISFFVYDPIKPDSNENIIKSEETETLKVYITKNGSYYLTRVWAEDPYSQLNKKNSEVYGQKLTGPIELLGIAVKENNLSDKLVVGFNASGFYLRNTYDAASVEYYSAYDRTSVGTIVITDEKVIRNAYNKWYKTWFISGVDEDNLFRIFTDSKMEINEKKEWADSVIASGIRNTFSFASPLVIDGQASNIVTSMPGADSALNRQAFCQVNENNFLLITGGNLSRSDLISIMLKHNCQTGTNFDGGGSIALLFKSANSNSVEAIIGGWRDLTEVGYFTE